MNTALEGDVDPSFISYDHEVNLTEFRTFCERWGIDVSAEGAEGLMELFESFECSHSGAP